MEVPPKYFKVYFSALCKCLCGFMDRCYRKQICWKAKSFETERYLGRSDFPFPQCSRIYRVCAVTCYGLSEYAHCRGSSQLRNNHSFAGQSVADHSGKGNIKCLYYAVITTSEELPQWRFQLNKANASNI